MGFFLMSQHAEYDLRASCQSFFGALQFVWACTRKNPSGISFEYLLDVPLVLRQDSWTEVPERGLQEETNWQGKPHRQPRSSSIQPDQEP